MNVDEIKRLIDKIRPIVSATVGQNHSLVADLDFSDIIGIRRVEITVTHEANATKGDNLKRIGEEIAPILEQICNNLVSIGYSVTEAHNLNTYVGGDNRARALIRCSLVPVENKQAQPDAASTESISTPALETDNGPAINWG